VSDHVFQAETLIQSCKTSRSSSRI